MKLAMELVCHNKMLLFFANDDTNHEEAEGGADEWARPFLSPLNAQEDTISMVHWVSRIYRHLANYHISLSADRRGRINRPRNWSGQSTDVWCN
jgi:hypothetical protein